MDRTLSPLDCERRFARRAIRDVSAAGAFAAYALRSWMLGAAPHGHEVPPLAHVIAGALDLTAPPGWIMLGATVAAHALLERASRAVPLRGLHEIRRALVLFWLGLTLALVYPLHHLCNCMEYLAAGNALIAAPLVVAGLVISRQLKGTPASRVPTTAESTPQP